MYLNPYFAGVPVCLAMDIIEVFLDPPLPAYLTIPVNAESFLPERCLSVTDLLQIHSGLLTATLASKFGQIYHQAVGVQPELLLSCTVPRQEALKQLLENVCRLSQSFNRAATSSSDVLPDRLLIWVLSFWDCLFDAYRTCLSWRRSLDWAKGLCTRDSPNFGIAPSQNWVSSPIGSVHLATSMGARRPSR